MLHLLRKRLACLLVLAILSFAVTEPVWAASGGHGPHIGASPADEKAGLISWQTDLAVFSFIVFVLLVAVLYKFAFGPISKALEAREAGIRQNIADAKAEREKAEELRGEYEGMLEAAEDKVRNIYSEAHEKAEKLRAERLAEADKEAEARKEQAIAEIDRAKDQAVQELFDAMSSRVADATEHVLGRSLTSEDQSRLIEDALSSLSNKPS